MVGLVSPPRGREAQWRIFRENFADYATGVLDFYHAVQYICKGARERFNGSTADAKAWFAALRRQLWQGQTTAILIKM